MKHLALSLLILYGLVIHAQTFEGTLTYVNSVDVAHDFLKLGMSKNEIIDKLREDGAWADTIWMTYDKFGNYFDQLSNAQQAYYIYKADVNKMYSMKDGKASEACVVTDASIDVESLTTGKQPTITKLDRNVMVNGVSCNVVEVKWQSGSYYYYYNPAQLIIDPTLMSNHIYDGWSGFLAISHALPAKIVKNVNGMMTITFTLVSAKQGPVDEKLFSLPRLAKASDLNLYKLPNSEIMRIKK